MSQARPDRRIVCSFILLIASSYAHAQGYDDSFEMRSKLKVELQYADYGDYEYPEPILFMYGVRTYQQNEPYIVNFPEKRFLIKYTRLAGEETMVGVKYQYSGIRTGISQHFMEGKLTKSLGEPTTGFLSGQVVYDSRGFSSYAGGLGCAWEASVLTELQGDVQYFYRGSGAEVMGGKLGTLNARCKIRQVLTLSTALLVEYQFFDARGDAATFTSHSVGVWLSQFFPTQTAIHLHGRIYTNTAGISSLAPSLEIAQYLDWATVLWVRLRYYKNKSDNVSLGEQGVVIPDGLISRSISLQLNRELSSAVTMYGKYRWYNSSLHVQMNTYLLGAVWSF
jgi:hypothetical protein